MESAPRLTLDHCIIAVSDLDEGAAELARVLGRGPSWRGRHPAYGTANVLFRLDNAYLELLTPDPEAQTTTPWTEALRSFLDSRGDGLWCVALATDDLAASVAGLRAAGLKVEEPLEGRGVNLLDGSERRWTNARIAAESTRGTRAFVIQHLSPPDALPPAPRLAEAGVASELRGASIESSEPDGARRMWRGAFGLQESEAEGGWRLDMGNAALLLFAGAGEADAPDRWQRLLLGSDSFTALSDRLDAQRLDFEQGDFREGYGILVRCCGADLLFLSA